MDSKRIIRIRRDTLHYRLASVYGGDPEFRWLNYTTVCSYAVRVLVGAFLACVMTGVLAAFLAMYVDLAIWTWFWITRGVQLEPNIKPLFGASVALLTLVAVCVTVFVGTAMVNILLYHRHLIPGLRRLHLPKRLSDDHGRRVMEFIEKVYEGFREKFCPVIKFVNPDGKGENP